MTNVARHTLLPPASLAAREATFAAAKLPRAKLVGWSALIVLAFVALDAATMMFPYGPIPVTPWNPQVGLALAAVFLGGMRFAPAVVAAAIVAEVVVRVSGGWPFDTVGGAVLGLGYVATAFAMRARDAGRSIGRVDALRDFLLISLAGTGIGAFAYSFTFALLGDGGGAIVLSEGLRKWLGDYVGAVTLGPLLLALVDPRVRRPSLRSLGADALLFGLGLIVLLVLVFGFEPIEGHKLFYLLFVPLIYAAMRHDFAGAAVGVACVQVALTTALLASNRSPESATEYQLLMVVLAATTLLLGSATSERRHALAALARRSAELRAQQEALSDAMRVAAASETASTLAHEMSQPLSAIGTYARAGIEMLKRGTGDTAEIAGVLERIERETARSSDVVRRVRDFFRTGTVRREPTSVSALVDDAVEAVRDRLGRERIALEVDVAPQLPPVDADRVQIGTVLHNLLHNAIDALAEAPAPRRVRVTVRPGGDHHVEVDVEDSGPGVAESVVASLFEPLATTKPAGMGLGLAISRTIVQAHGGRLWLASSQPTVFRFTLPLHGQDQH